MTLHRQNGNQPAAGSVAVHRKRSSMLAAVIAACSLIGMATSASALTLSGGPVYALPGGGTCSVGGITTNTGGATVSCTGVNLGAHSNVYFGIRNDLAVLGNTMTGTAPTASSAAVFEHVTDTATSITYDAATTVFNARTSANEVVSSRLVLSLVGGTGSVVSTGGIPANNGNADIERLFKITSGTSFTIRVDVDAATTAFPTFENANPNVFNPTSTSSGAGGDNIARADLGFYFSDCGDGVVDSPEQCDLGAGNGLSTTCCTSTCTFRSAVEVCRAGAGPPCDNNELCTGAGAACPSDDAIINNGNVCRSGSGDICDVNETCTGVPGEGCPADDAPGNTSVICRVSSAGDVCDMDELCTGTPGATGPPDDAPGNFGNVCRTGSGDICDPNEICTGVPGQGCPADIVANPSTVCRTGSGDSCDPDELCTAVPGATCPGDVVLSAGTECRAAAGECDVAEECSGNATEACPANGFEPATTSCNQDNDLCTTDECNGSGACLFVEPLDCDDGNTCTQDSCDAIGGCEAVGAPAGTATCVAATKAKLVYKDKFNNSGDKLVFVWKGGPALVSNMGDPTQTTDYELCVYDNTGVQLAMGVSSGAGWKTIGPPSSPKGYKFKDSGASQDGVKLILTKGSNLDKGKAKVVGKKENLPDTATLPFLYPVTAELYADGGMCWTVEFDALDGKKNEVGKFIAKVKP